MEKMKRMKFSVCAVDRALPTEIPFPLRGRSYRECAERAAAWGFDGIELQIQDPSAYQPAALRQALRDNGLAASAITTGLAYTYEGLSMTHAEPRRRAATVERLKRQLELAQALDSQILIGYLRGRKSPGQSDAEYEDILTDSLAPVLAYAETLRTPVVMEQINRQDGDVFCSTARTMEFLEKFHSPWLLYNGDTYHMASEDLDIPAAIRRSLSKLVLFHVSDAGRRLPDDRHFDFHCAAQALQAADYRHWVSIECQPLPDSDSACQQGIAYLRQVFAAESRNEQAN